MIEKNSVANISETKETPNSREEIREKADSLLQSVSNLLEKLSEKKENENGASGYLLSILEKKLSKINLELKDPSEIKLLALFAFCQFAISFTLNTSFESFGEAPLLIRTTISGLFALASLKGADVIRFRRSLTKLEEHNELFDEISRDNENI